MRVYVNVFGVGVLSSSLECHLLPFDSKQKQNGSILTPFDAVCFVCSL